MRDLSNKSVSTLIKVIPTIKEQMKKNHRSIGGILSQAEAEPKAWDRKDLLTKIKFVACSFLRIITKKSSDPSPVIISIQTMH